MPNRPCSFEFDLHLFIVLNVDPQQFTAGIASNSGSKIVENLYSARVIEYGRSKLELTLFSLNSLNA
jgi:hypothetical protein